MSIFTGAGVAVVTPFTPDNKVNYEKLASLVDYQIKKGTDAIIICGTTGESSTLTDEEHTKAIECAIKATAGRVPVIAGTGSNDTDYAVWLTKEAKDLGADAVLSVTPYYNKASQAGLAKHFTKIADSVDIPMILYNVPSRTGCNIALDTYKELAKHKNIVATKEASGNISAIASIFAECPELDVYSGNDDQTLPILALGGKGVISVASNVIPAEMHSICDLYFKGETEKAKEIFFKYLKLMNDLFIDVNPIPVKCALNYMGFDVGDLRLPMCELSEKNAEYLKNVLKCYSLL
ncbi:MAG: 4-hydroxy-tetrahydrodipicolinate synthase [Clostridia bacterium]|nr:4-hydroxy-tetrahydrodipicolinate synthase [Clostridia bacterium]